MLIGNALTREPCTGARSGEINLVQRRERNHGRGIPDINSRPIARSTPAFQTGKAPDGHTDMREPANKSLLTDVSRLCSYRCTIIVSTTSLAFVEGTGCGAQST